MILKFDDVIYKKVYTIEAKNEIFDVEISITDEDSEKIGASVISNFDISDEVVEILFKENTDKLKKVLIGFNFNQFLFTVLGDYGNFLIASLQQGRSITKQQ